MCTKLPYNQDHGGFNRDKENIQYNLIKFTKEQQNQTTTYKHVFVRYLNPLYLLINLFFHFLTSMEYGEEIVLLWFHGIIN